MIRTEVTVRLESTEGEFVDQRPADAQGQFYFQFPYLRKGTFVLTASAEGFHSTQQVLYLKWGGNQVIVNLFITPVGKTKTTAPPPGLTDLSAPKGARKELEKGVIALKAGKLPQAQGHFEKAVEKYPCYARAQCQLALVLREQSDLRRAEATLKTAIECDAGFTDAHTQLGQLLLEQERFVESEIILQEAVRRSPSAWQLYYQLAATHFAMGRYAKAEEDLLKARSLNPAPPPELYLRLADLYLKRGATREAYAEMQEYLRAAPSGPYVGRVRSLMQQVETCHGLEPTPHQTNQAQPSEP